MGPDGSYPPASDTGRPVPVAYPNPSTWTMTTDSPGRVALRLRLTDVPGWHATVDGHPLALTGYNGIMQEADLPPGRHVVTVTYWPGTITLGLIVAACSLFGLLALGLVGRRRRASLRQRTPDTGEGP